MIYLTIRSYLAVAGLLKLAHEDYNRLAKRSSDRRSSIVANMKGAWPKFKANVKHSFELMGQYPLQ